MANTTKKRGQFFAVDKSTWAEVCNANKINEAVAYLILAQGTGLSNRTTSWSATSLMKYGGVGWERARLAIEGLMRRGFLRPSETSTKGKPRYELPSAQEIIEARTSAVRACLTADELQILDDIRNRKPIGRSKCDRRTVGALVSKGLVVEQGYRNYLIVDRSARKTSERIWLPNSLVTGTERGEESPVRRLRAAGDVWTLRLLVDLYYAQNLRDDGGIQPGVVRQEYDRRLVGQQGIFNVWAFQPLGWWTCWADPVAVHRDRKQEKGQDHPIFDSVRLLERHGLLTFVPHLWEQDPVTSEAEVIHPYGIGDRGESIEVELGRAAHSAGLAMVPDFKSRPAWKDGFCYFAPVRNTLPNVTMVGIARLRYRPHTSATRAWYGDLYGAAQQFITQYRSMEERAVDAQNKTA